MTDYTNPSVYGVVVVVYCTTTKRFYILRELKDKPVVYKKAGMLAFVSETSMPHDKDVLATSHRAVDEEVGSGIINDDDIFVREKPVEGLPHSVPVYAAWVTVDEEFCEIPLDGLGAQGARRFFLQVLVQRVCAAAVDLDFGHHGEADTIIELTKFLHLGIGAWLLRAKLITGQGQYR